MQYIDREGVEHYFSFKAHPESMKKKITLMEYFRNYMQENLVKVRRPHFFFAKMEKKSVRTVWEMSWWS